MISKQLALQTDISKIKVVLGRSSAQYVIGMDQTSGRVDRIFTYSVVANAEKKSCNFPVCNNTKLKKKTETWKLQENQAFQQLHEIGKSPEKQSCYSALTSFISLVSIILLFQWLLIYRQEIN